MNDQFIEFDDIDQHGPRKFKKTIAVTPDELDRPELENVGPVEIEGEARKGEQGGEYVAEGEVRFQLDLRCARCVDPYPFANTSAFTVRYRPLPAQTEEEAEVELAGDELDTEFYSERQIPLRQIAVDQIQLALPMKPLCDEACQGLCPKCGTNRNRAKCACEENVFDERWSALKDLRDQLSKKKEV